MGLNDPDAGKLKPKSRGIIGASMPSRRAGDPRNYRSEGPMLSDRLVGDGLVLTNDGRLAVDWDAVQARLPDYIHTTEVVFNAAGDTDAVDGNQPSAPRFLFNAKRHINYRDLSLYRQVRFEARRGAAAAAAGSPFIELRYLATDGASAGDFLQIGAAPVRLIVTSTLVTLSTDWIDLVPAARGEVYLAVIGEGGDGVEDPNYGYIGAHFRR